MSEALENASLSDIVRDLLLAMVTSQNEANSAFIESIEELAATDVTLTYTKTSEGRSEKREIKGSALSFGVMPTLLNIQSSTIEIKTALSATKNRQPKTVQTLRSRSDYLFKTNIVDAKYQNAYNYKPETAATIRLTMVPVPPSQELLDAVRAAASKT
jgi:hypothetical protein